MYVAGYFMTFATIRALLNKLEIDDRGVEEERLEWPINNWLAEQGRLNMLAGSIGHPVTGKPDKDDGILLMTQFLFTGWESNPVVQENDRDIRVKEWLMNEVGIKPDEMEWMSLWDDFELTRSGIAPQRNEIRGHRKRDYSRYRFTSDHHKRWMASGKHIEEFLKDEEKEGRWPNPPEA
jgi:hypothetical protein